MRSVRTRLFVSLSVLVVGMNIVFGLLAYFHADDEATEIQDAVLGQVGQLAIRSRAAPAIERIEAGEDEEFRVVIEELVTGTPSFLLGGVTPGISDGITTIRHNGRDWRLLVVTRPDGRRFGIGQSTESRDERVRDALFQTLFPALLLMPCLLLLVGAVIHASFRPLSILSARLDARATDHMRILPTQNIPDEIRPFIEAINRLLGRLDRMFEQRRRFVADAAHELRTPVTALTVQAENLSRLDLPSEGSERLIALQGGIRRVARLLEQLLSLARYEAGPSGITPVTALDMAAREVVSDLMAASAVRSMDLGFSRIEAVAVEADSTSLQVMIRNLVDNAICHGSEGGRIDVEVFRDDSDAVCRVVDDGPGIPAHELDRIVDPFVRGGHADGDGTGLGLSIVKSIADACRGTVQLSNNTDGSSGLVVTVRFPLAVDGRTGCTNDAPIQFTT